MPREIPIGNLARRLSYSYVGMLQEGSEGVRSDGGVWFEVTYYSED